MRFLQFATALFIAAVAGGAGRPPAAMAAPDKAAGQQIREVTVVAERWEFEPNRIEVMQGDHVKIVVRSADGTHGFAIKAFHVHATVPRDGEPVTVEFDANRAGTYEISCFEYCGTGHRHMKATLVVDPLDGESRKHTSEGGRR